MTPLARFVWRRTLLLTLFVAVTACARGVDEARLQSDLQQRLDDDIKAGLFEVVGIRRKGSAPLPAASNDADRMVVYFNVTLRVAQDYRFGGWDQLGPGSIAFALGATEQGVFGLKPENRTGDVVRAYGSAVYEQTGQGWVPGAFEPQGASRASSTESVEGSAAPSRSKQMIDQLASMVELPPPGVPPQQDEIIAEELLRASENIARRVKRGQHVFTVATGPEDGEYARLGTAIIAAVNEVAPNVQLRQRHSEGSVENVWLLARGEADYAIVQGDVAAAAYDGRDLFAQGGPVAGLRAVGGLFPETIHVVVLQDSPIREVRHLRGRRVALGTASSGTRFDALTVLMACGGITAADLAEASEDPLDVALARLRRKELDAVFATGVAPIRALQQFAATSGVRLLSIDEPALNRILEDRPGLSRITMPANTYPQQRSPVVSAAATALLVTTADAPSSEVERVVDLLFTRMPEQRASRADVVRITSGGERRGVTIPLHPGVTPIPR